MHFVIHPLWHISTPSCFGTLTYRSWYVSQCMTECIFWMVYHLKCGDYYTQITLHSGNFSALRPWNWNQLLTTVQYVPASALLHFCIAAMTLSLVPWANPSAIVSAMSVLNFPSRICKEAQHRLWRAAPGGVGIRVTGFLVVILSDLHMSVLWCSCMSRRLDW